MGMVGIAEIRNLNYSALQLAFDFVHWACSRWIKSSMSSCILLTLLTEKVAIQLELGLGMHAPCTE